MLSRASTQVAKKVVSNISVKVPKVPRRFYATEIDNLLLEEEAINPRDVIPANNTDLNEFSAADAIAILTYHGKFTAWSFAPKPKPFVFE